MEKQFFVIRDAVHGDIYLTKEEGRILDTAAMQRLREIRQLGNAHLVYPSANHTRLEHSIGTVHMAQRMIDAINRNAELEPDSCIGVTEQEQRFIRLAALLHDVTHIPQGHSIEDQTGLFARHDTPYRYRSTLASSTELGQVLDQLGVRQDVLRILLNEDLPPYCAQIMSDTICADIFDYLKRDAYFTGLNLYYDERLVNYFKIDKQTGNLFIDFAKHSMLREDILSECLRMLEARYYFSERVYCHHAKIAAGALVAKAAEYALSGGVLQEEDFYQTTDAALLDLLYEAPIPQAEVKARMRYLLDCLRKRQLPKRVCIFPLYCNQELQTQLIEEFFTPGKHEARAATEQRIAGKVKESSGQNVEVIFYCPKRKMQLKEADLHVRWPGENKIKALKHFADRVPRLKDLEQAYRNLWKFYVFAVSDDPRVLRQVQAFTLQEFPAAKNVYSIDL